MENTGAGVGNGIQQLIVYVSVFAFSTGTLLCVAGKNQKHYLVFIQFVFLCVGRAEIRVPHALFDNN
ncbi:MAG: hypothetical protein Q4C50_09050 [Eubacteriales bacterium]|nr:hypothetical protein [Eubacteriales bacterium]